jgi:hypothetical protein
MASQRARLDLNHTEGTWIFSVMQSKSTIASFAGHLLGSGVFADPKLFTMHLLLGCLIALSKVRQQYHSW